MSKNESILFLAVKVYSVMLLLVPVGFLLPLLYRRNLLGDKQKEYFHNIVLTWLRDRIKLFQRLHQKYPHKSRYTNKLAQTYREAPIQIIGDREEKLEKTFYFYYLSFQLERREWLRSVTGYHAAQYAFLSGQLDQAEEIAKVLLRSDAPSLYISQVQQYIAHIILGRVALERKQVGQAKTHLKSATQCAKGKGIRLTILRPDMSLAKGLLDHGMQFVVIEYLKQFLSHSSSMKPIIEHWIEEINGGKVPDFGMLGRWPYPKRGEVAYQEIAR